MPGLAVVVRLAAGARVSAYLGSSDPASGAAVGEGTVFQACSISKPVTAACAMALVDRGVLDLDEPVWSRLRSWAMPRERCAGFDPGGVTLRRVLSHSAGLTVHKHGWASADGAPGALSMLRDERDPEMQLRMAWAPGALVYSGGGYLLLQLLIEDATRRPFADVARELVLRPLGMASSDYAPGAEVLARLAVRHDAQNRPMPRGRLAVAASSGLYTTAADLARFWSSVLPGDGDGGVLGRAISPGSAAEMLKAQSRDAEGRSWGLGFHLWAGRSDTEYSHEGFGAGWWGCAEGLVRRGVVFVVLTNGDRGVECVRPLAVRLREMLCELTL